MSEGPRVPLQQGIQIARELILMLEGTYQRICVAGSIRRGKPDVGDVELLILPNNRWAARTDELVERGLLEKRLVNSAGGKQSPRWGPKLRWAVHKASGINVDMYTADAQNWGYQQVLRTGPGAANEVLVTVKGVRNHNGDLGILNPTLWFKEGRLWRLPLPVKYRGDGAKLPEGSVEIPTPEEEDVYAAVGLPWLPPDVRSVELYQYYAWNRGWDDLAGKIHATAHNRNFDADGHYRGIPHDAISIQQRPYWLNVPAGAQDDEAEGQVPMFHTPTVY